MVDFKEKTELTETINSEFISWIKAKIIRNCVDDNDIEEPDIFRDYVNSLNADETIFLWDIVKTLGWIDFINCINNAIKSFKAINK